MTGINPSARTSQGQTIQQSDFDAADAAAQLAAMQMQQAGHMQSLLAGTIQQTRHDAASLSEINETATELGELQDTVVANETAKVDEQVTFLKSLRSSYTNESTAITEADLAKIQQFEELAKHYGFADSLTKEVEVPAEEDTTSEANTTDPTSTDATDADGTDTDATKTDATSDDGTDAAKADPAAADDTKVDGTEETEETEPEMMTVIDQQALADALIALRTYVGQLKDGTADNAVLQGEIVNQMQSSGMAQKMQTLGFDGNINTLAGMKTAVKGMVQHGSSLAGHLQQARAKFNLLLPEIQDKHDFLADFMQSTTKAKEQAAEGERELEREITQQEQLERAQREIEQLMAEAEQLQSAWESRTITGDALLDDLPPQAMEQYEKEYAAWEADFQSRWEELENNTQQQWPDANTNQTEAPKLKSPRRDYL